MWDKPTRYSIFSAIYELVFWLDQDYANDQYQTSEQVLDTKFAAIEPASKAPAASFDSNAKIEWEFIFQSLKLETQDLPDQLLLDKLLTHFRSKQAEYTQILKNYLSNWDKTFPVVKACLFTFLLEKETLEQENTGINTSEIITKYIRISEDYIGGQNVGLVHAILSKINPKTEV